MSAEKTDGSSWASWPAGNAHVIIAANMAIQKWMNVRLVLKAEKRCKTLDEEHAARKRQKHDRYRWDHHRPQGWTIIKIALTTYRTGVPPTGHPRSLPISSSLASTPQPWAYILTYRWVTHSRANNVRPFMRDTKISPSWWFLWCFCSPYLGSTLVVCLEPHWEWAYPLAPISWLLTSSLLSTHKSNHRSARPHVFISIQVPLLAIAAKTTNIIQWKYLKYLLRFYFTFGNH